jgi:flagellar biosynthesis GTPase FlhF
MNIISLIGLRVKDEGARKQRNSEAQKRHRQRKAQQLEELSQLKEDLTAENKMLADTNEKLKEENEKLKEENVSLRRTIQEFTKSHTPPNREMLRNDSQSLGSEEPREGNADLWTMQERTESHPLWNESESQLLGSELPLDWTVPPVGAYPQNSPIRHDLDFYAPTKNWGPPPQLLPATTSTKKFSN